VQRFELLVSLLLARQRQSTALRSPGDAGGMHLALDAAVAALPSELLATVAGALSKLELHRRLQAQIAGSDVLIARVARESARVDPVMIARTAEVAQCTAELTRLEPETAKLEAEHAQPSSDTKHAASSAELGGLQTYNQLWLLAQAQTAVQLKALCGQRGLRKTGSKSELVARLCDAACSDKPAPKRPRPIMEPCPLNAAQCLAWIREQQPQPQEQHQACNLSVYSVTVPHGVFPVPVQPPPLPCT
jgi:hypothetical protein